MKILLSINKKAIALLLSFLVILSSFSLIYTSKVSADTTSRSTNTKMMYQTLLLRVVLILLQLKALPVLT